MSEFKCVKCGSHERHGMNSPACCFIQIAAVTRRAEIAERAALLLACQRRTPYDRRLSAHQIEGRGKKWVQTMMRQAELQMEMAAENTGGKP